MTGAPPKPARGRGLALTAALLVVPLVTGAGLLWAQQSGQVHLDGPYRLVPIGLVLLAIVLQVMAVTRAMVGWLTG